jgi:hypothetical protein
MSSYLLSISPEIRVVCPAAVPTWTVFTGTSSGCTRGAKAKLREPLLGPGASLAQKPPRHGPPGS